MEMMIQKKLKANAKASSLKNTKEPKLPLDTLALIDSHNQKAKTDTFSKYLNIHFNRQECEMPS
jgi:hypothetical protein